MRKPVRAVATLMMLAATACGPVADTVSLRSTPTHPPGPPLAESPAPTPSNASSTSPVPSAERTLPDPVILPRLSRQGVVVERPHGIVFIALDGQVVARLDRFSLYYEWTVPGPVILQLHPHEFFVLRVGDHMLRPLRSRDAAFHLAPQFQEGIDPARQIYPDIPLPHGPPDAAGFWAYTLPSPDGSVLLEQWSGECEVPDAFLGKRDGSDPRPVSGGWGLRHATESYALGWTFDGLAVVNLLSSAFGATLDRPGVYLFRAPVDAELLFGVKTARSARMWGTA